VISTEGHPHAGIAPRELIQVLTNIFANSWQALPEGQSFRNRIDVQISMDGDHVIIEVADTGAGIAPENLPKIFDLFFTTRRDGGGTGLGLHIVKTIVTFRKGEVSVTSEPGKGTTFRIRLPPPEKR